jgi:IrrE N-terminal-like domain
MGYDCRCLVLSSEELKAGLVRLLQEDGLDALVREQGLIRFIERLGLRVCMTLGIEGAARKAQIKISDPPVIHLFRGGNKRWTIDIGPDDERKLTHSERFSVAHEVGHWLAYNRLGVEPISAVTGRSSDYWKHEQAINAFAGSLLVSTAVLERPLTVWPKGVHFPAHAIERISREIRASRIVVAHRVAESRNDFAYLELEFSKNQKERRLILRANEVGKSDDLKMPGTKSVIRNDRLVETLKSSQRSQKFMAGISFDGKRIDSLHMSWLQIPGVVGSGFIGDDAWNGRLVMTCWSREDHQEGLKASP